MTAMRALVAMVLALAGCGDGESSGADLSAGSCSGSLSGAVSEKIVSCKVTWDEQSGAADVGNDGAIAVSDPTAIVDDGTEFGFVFSLDGDFRAGPLSSANVTMFAGGVFVRSDGGADQYAASFSGNSPMAPPAIGAMRADLTSAAVDFTTATERQWIVHGHLSATFVRPPPFAGGDTVQLTLDF